MLAVGVGIAIVITLVVTHRYVVPPVVRGIGTLLGHHEPALRAAGWFLGGGAWVVGGFVVFFRPNAIRRTVVWLLAAWVVVNAPFLPSRRESGHTLRRILGSGYHDGRFLLFGIGAGLLAALVALVGDLLVVSLLRGRGPFQPKSPAMFRAIAGWYFLAMAGGFVFALAGPAPSYR